MVVVVALGCGCSASPARVRGSSAAAGEGVRVTVRNRSRFDVHGLSLRSPGRRSWGVESRYGSRTETPPSIRA